MKKMIFSILFLLPFTTLAATFDNPTVKVNGVDHGLVDMDDKTGEIYDSADGFCKKQGFQAWTSLSSSPTDSGPIAILDIDGNVTATFPNNAEGNFWIVDSVDCQ